MRAVFLVIFFYQKLAAFGTILVNGLKVTDKIAFGIIGAAKKTFAPAFGFAFNNVTAAFGTFGNGNRPGIPAIGETGTGKEKTKTPQFLYHGFSAFFTNLIGRFIKGALKRFDVLAYFFHI